MGILCKGLKYDKRFFILVAEGFAGFPAEEALVDVGGSGITFQDPGGFRREERLGVRELGKKGDVPSFF